MTIKMIAGAVLLQCCAMAVADDLPPDAKAPELESPARARIRVFGRNSVYVDLFKNSECYTKKFIGTAPNQIVASGGFSDTMGSFFGTVSNVTIGMPESPTTRRINDISFFGARAFFKEYEIEAGQPLTLNSGIVDPYVSCQVAASFIPKPGKDYEVFFQIQGSACFLQTKEIVTTPDGTDLAGIAGLKRAFICSENK